MTRRLPVACAAVAVLVLGACAPGNVPPLPPAPKVALTTTTAAVDYTAIGLAAVPGRTTTTIQMGPGTATLNGVVNGPAGPVAGAVVHAERLVGDAVATMDLLTQPDGTFSLPNVLGGRYRLRAWKPAPDNLALVEPQVFFLEGSEKKQVTLGLTLYQGVTVTAAVAPDPPIIESPANLVVLVVNREVDAGGFVRSTPVPGAGVELFGSGDWKLQSPNPTTADANGRAQWALQCQRAGNQPLSVVVANADTFNLNLPGCSVPPDTADDGSGSSPSTTATPGTTAAPSTTKPPPATTTTARPSTTTTTH